MGRAKKTVLRLHARGVHTPSFREERSGLCFRTFSKYFSAKHQTI